MINILFLLQADLAGAADTLPQQAGEMKMNIMEMAVMGGWIMIPILVLSVLAVYIFFERYFLIQKASRIDMNFMNRIKDYIHDGKLESALSLCQSYQNPAARMVEKGIRRIGRPLQDVNTSIENVGNLEIASLEKTLYILAMSAGGAPMLGFLGTVTGMVRAFYDMAHAGNNIDIQLLSNGIYQAMITTVAGLVVGIMAYFFYNILTAKIAKVVNSLEATTMEFMDLLNEPAK